VSTGKSWNIFVDMTVLRPEPQSKQSYWSLHLNIWLTGLRATLSKVIGRVSGRNVGIVACRELLLGNARETNETTDLVRQRSAHNNGSTVGSDVFYVLRSERLSYMYPVCNPHLVAKLPKQNPKCTELACVSSQFCAGFSNRHSAGRTDVYLEG
jgi:hypothetical protein